MRQLRLSVTVPLVADVGAALARATDVVTRNPRVLKDPLPMVGITAIGDGSIRSGVDPWLKVTDVGPADIRLVDGAALTAAR
jgi:small conductance mechanosensitive channel